MRSMDMTDAFNGAVLASAITAAEDLGLFDAIASKRELDVAAFAKDHELDLNVLRGIITVLHKADVVDSRPRDAALIPGARFEEANANRGFFLWLMRGHGHVLTNAGRLTRKAERATPGFTQLDGPNVAKASRICGRAFVGDVFDSVIDSLDFTGIADLGCGAAARLIQVAARRPTVTCVGVDIDGPTVQVAREAVEAAGLSHRIDIVHADATRLQEPRRGVQALFSVFMAHDLWPRENCLATLRSLTQTFPDLTDVVLADTHRSEVPAGERQPMFSMGFELIHAIKGEYIPSEPEWRDVFNEVGWELVERRRTGIPFTSVFHLKVKR